MKAFLLAASAAVLFAGAAQADPFDGAYGNTLTTVAPDGTRNVSYVNRDGTWEQHMANGTVMKGTFTWKDDHTACFTVVDPAPKDPSTATGCQEIKGSHGVGETWVDIDPKGQKYTMSITAGRQ